ncbi:hypothetical protein ARTHRO9AX_150060 [Arthrobacter sp. 9AX]|nr:hypothetical protein ARTHRO9AX_150060 [Arthrobacter sp. 9AX]
MWLSWMWPLVGSLPHQTITGLVYSTAFEMVRRVPQRIVMGLL